MPSDLETQDSVQASENDELQASIDASQRAQALSCADDIISDIKNVDYTAGREEIARTISEGIWEGNWDSTTDFAGAGLDLPELRFIEENEYDQSMSEDEKPDWDTLITEAAFGYVFPA